MRHDDAQYSVKKQIFWVSLRAATGGKTDKAPALPEFFKINCGGGSAGAAVAALVPCHA